MTLTIAPLAEHEVETLCALAAETWRDHYPPIIGTAQTEYMLAQRYDPNIVREELARGAIWWDTLAEDERIVAFASSFPVEGGQSDLLINLWYAYGLERELPSAIQALREAVRRRPTDDASHYVLGVALQMSGYAGEGARERELAWRLSSEYDDW